MEVRIYGRNGEVKLTVAPSSNSSRQRRLMGEHVLNLSFTAFEYRLIEAHDYAEWDGMRFWAIEGYAPEQRSTMEWMYDCRFYGIESLLQRALMLDLTDGRNDPLFTLTAPAREHAALAVANINRMLDTSDWKVGEVADTPLLTIDYRGTYCAEALAQVAREAKTEFWVDGLTINLCRCERGEPIALGYGNGLISLEREAADNVAFFTRLIPLGSTRNIDSKAYGYARLQLPDRATSVERSSDQGLGEHYEADAFAGIYPRRIGTLSGVRSEQRTGDDGEPFTIYYVRDEGLDFDPNSYEIGGLVKQMTFQSGELQGRDFEVNYDSAQKEFEIITQWPYDDQTQLPGGALVPKAGDEYILWNIRMPERYYALAEQEFAQAVHDYMEQCDQDRFIYKGASDYVDLAARGLTLDVGQRVRLESAEYFPGAGYRMSRITSLSQRLTEPFDMELEVSEVLGKGSLERIDAELGEVKGYLRSGAAALPQIVRSWENTPDSDFNLFSARRSMKEFLDKRYPDVAQGLLKFLDGAHFGPFIPGAESGTGAAIDKQGHAEMTSLVLRSFLKVPNLRYNKVSVTGGEMWNTPGGVIAAVEPDGASDTAFILTLESEQGEMIELAEGDICKGHYNTGSGFVSSYFRVTQVDQRAKRVHVVLGAEGEVPGKANHAPVPYMNIAQYGSFTDAQRQQSQYFSSSEQRIALLSGVDQYVIEPKHYKVVLGSVPQALLPAGNPVAGRASIYLDDVLARNFFQLDANNEVIRTIRDRGLWSSDAEPYRCNERCQDEVYHRSCKWRCIVEGTLAEPDFDATDWLLVAGDRSLRMEIESSAGETFLYGQLSTTLRARVMRGVNDISAGIPASEWSWSRETEDAAADAVWNAAHAGCGNTLPLGDEDLGGASGRFTCQARVAQGEQVASEVSF